MVEKEAEMYGAGKGIVMYWVTGWKKRADDQLTIDCGTAPLQALLPIAHNIEHLFTSIQS